MAEDRPLNMTERLSGCLLAGAVGDALGGEVALADVDAIRRQHGPAGIMGPLVRDGAARVSDGTRMMLFTLEGLIRAHVAGRLKRAVPGPEREIQHAYQRWLHTQGEPWERVAGPYAHFLPQPDGWLVQERRMFLARAAGSSSAVALARFAQTHQRATPERRINDAQDGAAMTRAAPMTLWSTDLAEVFRAAVNMAALTHSHPTGYLPAGVLAAVVRQLLQGVALRESVDVARGLLVRWPGHEDSLRAWDAAVALSAAGPVPPEKVHETIGWGRTAGEALAIGLYAVLATGSLRDALVLAVNHSGDSSSAGIACGTIGGALHGMRGLPPEWLEVLELRDVIERLVSDAFQEFGPRPSTYMRWTERYPAW
jgi:ADP-ribosylglycohydrolase